jgi:hypothetical protein
LLLGGGRRRDYKDCRGRDDKGTSDHNILLSRKGWLPLEGRVTHQALIFTYLTSG